MMKMIIIVKKIFKIKIHYRREFDDGRSSFHSFASLLFLLLFQRSSPFIGSTWFGWYFRENFHNQRCGTKIPRFGNRSYIKTTATTTASLFFFYTNPHEGQCAPTTDLSTAAATTSAAAASAAA